MKFRDHPLLERSNGIIVWPPEWLNAYQDQKLWPQGEIGILEDVWMHELLDRALFLYVRDNGFHYTGSMYFDDRDTCMMFYNFLKHLVGRSIADIGDLDISQSDSKISVVSVGAAFLVGGWATL